MNPMRKKLRGEPIGRQSASLHNQMVDAIRAARSSQRINRVAGVPDLSLAGRVLVRNSSGAVVPRFGVLGIAGVAIEPEVNEDQFQNQPVLEGVTPFGGVRTFVIAQEPIAENAVGVAVASGVTVGTVFVSEEAEEEGFHFAGMGETTERLTVVESAAAEVLWREEGTGEKRAVLRLSNTPSDAVAGTVTLGIVVAPSTDGSAVGSYTVDVYGTTIDSLFDPATATGEVATQDPVDNHYYRGEIVGLTTAGAGYRIQKFLTLPIAYTVEAEKVCLRIRAGHALTFPNDSRCQPTNFLVDLSECLEFFDSGMENGAGHIGFSYGAFGGLGVISTALSVPVKFEVGWTLVDPTVVSTDLAAAVASVLTGTVSSASDSNDTFSSGWTNQGFVHDFENSTRDRTYAWTQPTFAPNAYVILIGASNRYLERINVRVRAIFGGTTSGFEAALFSGLPTLPAITGGVDNAQLLLGRLSVEISFDPLGGVASASAVNHLDPTITAWRSLAAGGASIGGSYAYVPSPVVLTGPVTVSSS